MKKIPNNETVGDEIDRLEIAAHCGRISRRKFITRLTQLGVSISAAQLMATKAAASAANRVPLRDEYDYIIAGAGPAGCVLASRLSQTGATVLLIEAGSDKVNQPKITDSRRFLENLGTETDWNNLSNPQTALNNRQLTTPTGRILGGGGSINAMMWLRSDVRDFRRWRKMVGPNWAPSRILRAFKRAENFQSEGNPTRRGKNGPIDIYRYANENPLTAASINGAKELGLSEVEHNSARRIDGVGITEFNILPNGRRSGPASGYLIPALSGSNLTIIFDTQVTSVKLEGSICRGVNAIMDGQEHQFIASKEVILSSGAFGSPRILMQSGIGPETELNSAGIIVAHNLSQVGKNLHDHMILGGIHFNAGHELSSNITLGNASSHAFFRTNPINEAPNIQVTCMQLPFPPGIIPVGEAFTILPWVSKPRSRGSVVPTGSRHTDPMLIDPAYLQDPYDLDTLISGFDYAIAWGLSDAMSPFVNSLRAPLTTSMTRQEKIDFIKQTAASGFHPVGTCAAGRDPNSSVVNQYFCVWGINNLRVVDGSVIPEIPGVNTHAPILALAELAAHTIINDKN